MDSTRCEGRAAPGRGAHRAHTARESVSERRIRVIAEADAVLAAIDTVLEDRARSGRAGRAGGVW